MIPGPSALDKYEKAMDGSWGCGTRYAESVMRKKQHEFSAEDWAYLAGHYEMLLGMALKHLDNLS